MSKFERAAKLFIEKQQKIDDRTKQEAELARLLKQMYHFGKATRDFKR